MTTPPFKNWCAPAAMAGDGSRIDYSIRKYAMTSFIQALESRGGLGEGGGGSDLR